MKQLVTWVVVADGTQAHVFEHGGPGKGFSVVPGINRSIPPLQSHEIGSDRPGRSFSSHGSHRSAMTPATDPAEHREAEFVRDLAAELDRRVKAGAFDRLVIAAAPTALGTLRKSLSEHVKRNVIGELNKDLTNVPTAELGKHLDRILSI